MAGRTFSEDLRNEMTGKAIMWGPAIAGAILFGPVGLFLGLAGSVASVASGSSSSPVPSGGDPPKDQAGDAAGRGYRPERSPTGS